MNIEDIVLVDKEVLVGTPVFQGTRVPVKTLLDYLEAGENLDVFLDHFPTVKREQVLEFLEISAKSNTIKDLEPLIPKVIKIPGKIIPGKMVIVSQ